MTAKEVSVSIVEPHYSPLCEHAAEGQTAAHQIPANGRQVRNGHRNRSVSSPNMVTTEHPCIWKGVTCYQNVTVKKH